MREIEIIRISDIENNEERENVEQELLDLLGIQNPRSPFEEEIPFTDNRLYLHEWSRGIQRFFLTYSSELEGNFNPYWPSVLQIIIKKNQTLYLEIPVHYNIQEQYIELDLEELKKILSEYIEYEDFPCR